MEYINGTVSKIDRTGKILAEMLERGELYKVMPTSEGYALQMVCDGLPQLIARVWTNYRENKVAVVGMMPVNEAPFDDVDKIGRKLTLDTGLYEDGNSYFFKIVPLESLQDAIYGVITGQKELSGIKSKNPHSSAERVVGCDECENM